MGNFPTVRLLTHPVGVHLTQTPVIDPLITPVHWFGSHFSISSTTRTMTKSNYNKKSKRTLRRRSVSVKLNMLTFQTMVRDIVKDLFGTGPHGRTCFYFQSTALLSLQEGAESFLENMWEQLKDIAVIGGRTRIELRDVLLWKRTTDFKHRH